MAMRKKKSEIPEVTEEKINIEQNNRDFEMIKLFYDFQFKSILLVLNTVTHALPIYFAILGAICAYFMTRTISPEIIKYIVLIVVSISLGGLIVYSVFVRGILLGFDELKHTFELGGDQIFKKSTINSFINRGKITILISLFVLYLVIIVI